MKRLCIALIAASLLIAGCGGPEDKFVGKWDGEFIIPEELLEMAKANAPENEKDQFDDLSYSLELKGDGTYDMARNSTGERSTGTWTLSEDGKTISMTWPKGENDNSYSMISDSSGDNMAFDISEDGKSISFDNEQMRMGMKFNKN